MDEIAQQNREASESLLNAAEIRTLMLREEIVPRLVQLPHEYVAHQQFRARQLMSQTPYTEKSSNLIVWFAIGAIVSIMVLSLL